MIVPQFLRFYQGYTLQTLLEEYAVTFFSLSNSMFRIKSNEMLESIQANAVPNMEKADANKIINELQKNSKGIHGIVQEVRNIKGI